MDRKIRLAESYVKKMKVPSELHDKTLEMVEGMVTHEAYSNQKFVFFKTIFQLSSLIPMFVVILGQWTILN